MEMRTIFNICDYGAVGDGKTDCTRAIQTALNLASECMGEVVVPPGVYKTGQVKMGPNTKLSGTSAWLFRDFGGSVFELNDPDAVCMIDITGAFGCHINGMSLCGCDLGENIHGVYLSWPVYNGGSKEDTPTLDDCKIGRFSGDGVHLHHIWCYSVRHCMLCFNGGAGLYMDGWDGFVIDNWFSANRRGGLLGGACTASVTATGNRVEWNRVGGFVIPGGSCLNITGNYFDRSGGPALRLGTENAGVRDLTITGNIFYRSGKPGKGVETDEDSSHVFLQNVGNTVLSGNTFRVGRDDGGVGDWSPYYGVIAKHCDHVICRDNAMHESCLRRTIVWERENEDTNVVENNIGTPATLTNA